MGGRERAPLAATIGAAMGLFNKILHAGEGKKLKNLESIVPAVGGPRSV